MVADCEQIYEEYLTAVRISSSRINMGKPETYILRKSEQKCGKDAARSFVTLNSIVAETLKSIFTEHKYSTESQYGFC